MLWRHGNSPQDPRVDCRDQIGLLITGDFKFGVLFEPFPHSRHRPAARLDPLGAIQVGVVHDDVTANGDNARVKVQLAEYMRSRVERVKNNENLLASGERRDLAPGLPAGAISFDKDDTL